MSLVVSDGYIFEGNPEDLTPLLNSIAALRNQAHGIARRDQAIVLANLAASRLDASVLFDTTAGPAPLRGILTKLFRTRYERSKAMHRDTMGDWGCQVSVMPLKNGPILLRLVAEKQDIYRQLFDGIDGIRDFFYDGRTDATGMKITDEECARRYDLWDRSTRNSAYRGTAPLVIELVPGEGAMPGLRDILDAIPDLKTRAARTAWHALVAEIMEAHQEKCGTGDAFNAYFRAVDYLKGDAGKIRLASKTEEHLSLLPAGYSLADIFDGYAFVFAEIWKSLNEEFPLRQDLETLGSWTVAGTDGFLKVSEYLAPSVLAHFRTGRLQLIARMACLHHDVATLAAAGIPALNLVPEERSAASQTWLTWLDRNEVTDKPRGYFRMSISPGGANTPTRFTIQTDQPDIHRPHIIAALGAPDAEAGDPDDSGFAIDLIDWFEHVKFAATQEYVPCQPDIEARLKNLADHLGGRGIDRDLLMELIRPHLKDRLDADDLEQDPAQPADAKVQPPSPI